MIRLLTFLVILLACAPSATAEPRLQLLTPPDPTGPTDVAVSINDLQIYSIREQDQVFELSGRLYMRWVDPRQSFDPEAIGAYRLEYQGESVTDMLKEKVWWPELEFINAQASRDSLAVNLTLDADGEVFYAERFRVEVKWLFDYNLAAFPFDSHDISFVLEPFTYQSDAVRFLIDGPAEGEILFEPTEWSVDDFEIRTTNFPAYRCPAPDGTTVLAEGTCSEASRCAARSECVDQQMGFPKIEVGMSVHRDPSHYVSNIILPLVLIVLIAAAVFWMDLRTTHLGDRLALPFTSILTVVAFDLVTAGDLPNLWYATTLDRIVTASYAVVVVNIAIVVLIDRLATTGRIERAESFNRIMRWVFPVAYLACVGWNIF